MDAEIVQECAIFAALAPTGAASALRARVASDQETTVLPMVHQGRRLFSPKTPRALMTSFPITAQECTIVWKYLSDWVQAQIAMEAPAAVPGFGIIALKSRGMQIRMPVFEPDRAFLDRFGLQMADSGSLSLVSQRANTQAPFQAKTDKSSASAPNVFAFSYLEMASCCGSNVDAIKAQEWLQAVIQKLGQAMNQSKRVELNIGVGIISCDHRVVDHHMLSRYSVAARSSFIDARAEEANSKYLFALQKSAPPPFQYEIRTGESVVKRKLLALSQQASSPKPRASFLSSKGFSQVIQLHPAFEQVNIAPSFDFELSQSPRPPNQYHGDSKYRRAPLFLNNSTVNASPRSQQLQARLRGSIPTTNDTAIVKKQHLPPPENENSSLATNTNSNDDFPEVFDSLGRTLCIEPSTNTTLLLPTNRIGSNFTVSAKRLMIEKSSSSSLTYGIALIDEEIAPHDQKIICLSGKPAFSSSSNAGVYTRKLEAVSRSQEQVRAETECYSLDELKAQTHDSRSEERYFSYLNDKLGLIDRRWLSPLSPKLTDRIIASAVKYLSEPPSGSIRRILDEAQEEFTANYYISLKKAVLDYLLLREESRLRLGIPRGVPAHVKLPERWRWGDGNGINGCFADLKALAARSVRPKAHIHSVTTRDEHNRLVKNKRNRQRRVRSKLNVLLMCSDPHVRALQSLWVELEASSLLVTLPNVEELNQSMVPLDIFAFERKQLDHAATMKNLLMDVWYHKVKQVFEDATKGQSRVSVSTDARLKHLFDVVGALMSLQVRSLLLRSIQAYVDFFELFAGDATGSASEDLKLADMQQRSSYSGLLTSMILRGGEAQFVNSLIDIPSHLLSVLQNFPQLFHNTNRIETQFEEPLLFTRSSAPFLWNFTANEDALVLATIRIREIIERNVAQLQQLQLQYDRFAHVYRTISSSDRHKIEDICDLPLCRNELANVRATATKMISEASSMVFLRLFCVDCRLINTMLLDGLAQWSIRMLYAFQEHTSRLNAELRNRYKEVAARLARKPADLYELVDAEVFVHSLKTTKLNELQEKANDIKQRIRFLLFEHPSIHVDGPDDSFAVDTLSETIARVKTPLPITSDLLASTAKTIKWRGHIDKLLQNAEASLVNERARIEMIFTQKRTRFLAEVEEFDSEVKTFSKKGDLRHAATYVVQLAKMKDALIAFRKSMESIVEEEAKLQWKPTDFSKLDDIAEEMDPYEQLWKTVREFREMNSRWLRSNIYELQAAEGIRTIQQMLSIISNVSKLLQLNSAAAAITADLVKKQMTDFRENIRLVAAILNPSMKERHLKEVSTLVALTLDLQEPVTLLKLLENGAFDHFQRIIDISANATQEKHVEQILQNIDAEWIEVQFTFKSPFNTTIQPETKQKSTSTTSAPLFLSSSHMKEYSKTLRLAKVSVENIKMLIGDHQQRLQTLLCMQHAIPFTKEITSWQLFMSNVLFVADQAILNQRLWKSLGPYFSANIVDKSSKEAKSFEEADQLHRSIINTIQNQPLCAELIPRTQRNALDRIKSDSSDLLIDLKKCYSLLEDVKECLRVGLESKRAAFPRFFILSDRELVSVLASHFPRNNVPADSRMFWSSLARCFPGIHHVNLNAAKEITALVSHAGEQMPIGAPIDTANTSMLMWLSKLESTMTTMLQACIRAAVNDLARKEFRKWCLLWPEQVMIASIQHTWTMQSELAISKPSTAEIKVAWNALAEDLREKIIALSKEIKAAAYPYLTISLGNIIMLLSYLREVSAQVHDEVARSSAENEVQPHWQSLTWLAQPRLYYDDNTLNVKVMTSYSLPYGFEYLGNVSSAILLTPLTLRCFQSVALTASTLGKGACLEGNASIGKATIFQALSRLCARFFVSYQCGNGPSVNSLTFLLKGTVSSAAWLCMSNFHLLDAVTVSTITQLCAQLMDHLLAKQTQCTFLGLRLKLKKGAYFAITLPLEVPRIKEVLLVPEARFFFVKIVVQYPDFEKLGEFYLEQGKFSDSTAQAKLIYVVLSAFQRGFKLIRRGVEHEISYDQQSLLSCQSIKKIVSRATELKMLDQSDQSSTRDEINPDDSFTDHKEARRTSKTEHLNVCIALLEYLSERVSTSSLDLVEFLLRDFAANRLVRQLHLSNSFVFRPATDSLPVPQISHTVRSDFNPTIEDSVEGIIRTSDPSWTIFGVGFTQKTIQLLHAIRSNRLAIISGESLCGKTSLYKGLARALTQIHETEAGKIYPLGADRPDFELASAVRCVIIPPRALSLDMLWGLSVDHHADTLLAKLIREAKKFYEVDHKTHTWIILDGNLDLQWAEQLLFTVVETQDNTPIHDRGLLLKSKKRLMLPPCARWIIESTSLANISPSFLTRTSIVNVGQSKPEIGWRGLYQTWKRQHEAEFEPLLDDIYRITDMLVDETLEACLDFVHGNFHTGFHQTRHHRVCTFLSLYHSSLKRCWAKLASMAGLKQRRTALHCFFLQALVWGIGGTSDALERQKFHMFLRHLVINGPRSSDSSLKRVIILFFPSGGVENSTSTNLIEKVSMSSTGSALANAGRLVMSQPSAAVGKETIYSFAFSIEFGLKWMPWGEYYDHWLQTHVSASSNNVKKGGQEHDGGEESVLTHFTTPTPNMAAALCLATQLLSADYAVVLSGPHDSGRTTTGKLLLQLHDFMSASSGVESSSLLSSTGNGRPQRAADSAESRRLYLGSCTSAVSLFKQLSPFIERVRSPILPRMPRTPGREPSADDQDVGQENVLLSEEHEDKPVKYIFIDDLHCVDDTRVMDSPIELCRYVVEQRQIVDLATNLLAPCRNFLPFTSVECPTIRSSNPKKDLKRLLARFVPISLSPLSDHDLSSISISIAAKASDNVAPASPEGSQLLTIIVKTSIKLFRILATEFRIATKAAYLPSKVHYMPHIRELFTLIKSVCCDAKPTLSFSEKPFLARLWCHESARVFGDKSINARDSTLFHQNLRDLALKSFSLAPDVFLPTHIENLSREATKFNAQVISWLSDQLHFTFVGESSGAGFLDGYREVNDMQKVELSIERSMMAMYRANVATESIELVLCGYVIQHILRISRLLRHDGVHALLLGSQGKKTVTITRLGAYICKKTAIVYYAGHRDNTTASEVDEGIAWIRAFKNAVLHSVRQPDSKIVFVFKDMYFSNMDYYELLDQFLSGVNLPSDVISYEDFDEQIIKKLHADACRASATTRIGGFQYQQQSLNSKGAILDQFYASVRKNFQLVIALAPTQHDRNPIKSSVIAQLLWSFPHIVKACAISYYMGWPEESLSVMAQKAFSSLVLVDKQRLAQLSQVSVLTYQSTRRFLERHCSERQNLEDEDSLQLATVTDPEDKAMENVRFSWNDRPSSHLHLDPSMLLDQIGLFVLHFESLETEIATTKARYEAGLAFMEKTEDLLAAEQSQAEILQPEMLRKTEFTRRMSGKIEKETLTSNKLSKGYEFATTLVEAQRQRVLHLEHEYQELIHGSMKVFAEKREVMRVFQEAMREKYPGESVDNEDMTAETSAEDSVQEDPKSNDDDDPDTAVKRFRRALIKNFISFKHVPTSLRQLAECLGLIFGIQSVEIRDELDADEIIMDYWESTTTRMKTALFWDEIVSFDVAARVDGNVVAKLLPICTSPEFSKDMFSGIHELAGILCEWVQACALFARDLVLSGPKLAQLANEREACLEAQNEINARKLEIQEQVNTTTETNVQRHVSELERQELEGKLQENATALQMTASVWKVLASSGDRWKKLHEIYTERSVQWMGDLMIATSKIAYTSSMSSHARAELRKVWSEALGKHFLLHSPNRAMHQVFNVQDLSLMKWHMDGLPSQDAHSLENAVIATRSYLFPVMIDPSGMASVWIKKHEAGNAVRVLSSRTATEAVLWDEVLKCVKKKSTLVLVDFGEDQAAILHSLIMAKRRGRFDLVNRDISNIANISSGTNGSSLPRTGLNGINQHRCWFQSRHEYANEQSSLQATYTHVQHEFGSDSCRIYFVYSEGDSLEPWMKRYMSQLCFIRFGLSTQHIRTKTMQKIAELQNSAQVFTEIQTLNLDMLSCEEQLEALESEILDFLCAETPEDMFSDTSKALKIVGNRSTYNTIESSKHESEAKIQLHLDHLEQYKCLVQRCVDTVWIVQDVSFALHERNSPNESSLRAPLHWLWTLLAWSLEGCGPSEPIEELTRKFTESMIQYVTSGLYDSDIEIFELLFGLRVYQHRQNAGENPLDVLFRLLLVLQCHDENQLKTLCASVLSKLLSLRPECVPAKIWRNICFLAEKSTELRQFIMHTTDKAASSTSTWKDLIENDGRDPSYAWQPLRSLSPLVQLCLISVVHKHLFSCDSKSFSWSELYSTSALNEPTLVAVEDTAITTYVATDLDALQLSHFKYFIHNSLDEMWHRFSSHRTPIIVMCTPGMDFSQQVAEMAKKAQVTINLVCNEETKDESFERNMVTAAQKGHWVVLPNMHLLPHRLHQLRNIYEMIDDIKPHLDFRVWISTMRPQTVSVSKRYAQSNEEAFLSRVALQKTYGSPVRFQTSLYNALKCITQDKNCQNVASTYEKLIVRIAVFHAMVSSCDLFAFARWKSFEEDYFSDLELRTVISCVSSLWTSSSQSADAWTTIHGAIANVYGSKVETYHEKLLISCCFDLLFPAPSVDIDHQLVVLNAAQRAIPGIVSAMHVLDAAGLILALEPRCSVWSNPSFVPKGTVWDFQLQHQQRQFAHRLMNLFISTAVVVPGAYLKMPPFASKSLSMAAIVELLTKFRSELDAFSFDPKEITTKFPKTYKKPLYDLTFHGIIQINAIREELLKSIQRLHAVCTGAIGMDPEARHQINAIASSATPVQWTHLVNKRCDWTECGPEDFLHDILARVKFFASCVEHEMPSRIPIDKFQHSEYVLEAIHQHFVRNHVGNTLCGPNCLRVVAIYEDRMQLTLPTKDDSLYVHGLRVKGHLQQDVVMTRVGSSSNSSNASSERKKSVGRVGYEAEILPQGIPVVLEVTSVCLSPNLSKHARSMPSIANTVARHRNSNAAPVHLTDTGPITEFLCPLYRGGGERDYHRSRPETSIYIVSSLPLGQLVFSGSCLHIDSMSDSPMVDC